MLLLNYLIFDMSNESENTEDKQNKPWQFQPGVSGNPAGKPKGVRHMSTLLEEAIRKVANGDDEPADRLIVRKMIDKAKAGEDRTIEHIFDRLEGKAPQEITITPDTETDLLKEELQNLSDKFNEFLKNQ